MLQATAK